jgi:predicted TIM-barrel fold metal-dependent hydrolase
MNSREHVLGPFVGTLPRRAFLRAAGAAIALPLLNATVPARAVAANTAQTGSARHGRLDLHHHFGSPLWINKVKASGRQSKETMNRISPVRSLEEMDKADVSTAFLSCTMPGAAMSDDFASERSEAIALARDLNDYGARLVSDHTGRFALFGVLPLPDVEASLREIEYVFDTLKADGVGILTSYQNIWLGDVRLQPVFDELNRRKAIVYVHPVDAPCCRSLIPGVSFGTVELNTDTSRAIVSLLSESDGRNKRTSAATRYADIRFIWSHAGGTLTSLSGRILGGPASPDVLARPPELNSNLYHLRRFYYDTALSTNALILQPLKNLVGLSQMVFGTDYPFASITAQVDALRKCGFSEGELESIERGNGARLMPKYA